ncbi:hypothetical protein [Comamonas sp.]|uniref:hypothetical protein n=1 Tax=Comamonas sp. TaxID=34028 RepID=UPI0028ABBD96|nr:hypothetical protein [Comamonas sp.]
MSMLLRMLAQLAGPYRNPWGEPRRLAQAASRHPSFLSHTDLQSRQTSLCEKGIIGSEMAVTTPAARTPIAHRFAIADWKNLQ